MKLREIITEMPYLHPGEMPRKMLDGTISWSAIDREYHTIGHIGDIEVKIDRHNSNCIGLDSSKQPTGDRVRPIFKLVFKHKHELNFQHNIRNLVQIDKVAIQHGRGNDGVMSQVYKILADHGYSVISDSTQFEPAQSLWMKIANDPNYAVRIADVDRGFFKDADGRDMQYRGPDLIKADAWTTGSDFKGYNRVIVLTKH